LSLLLTTFALHNNRFLFSEKAVVKNTKFLLGNAANIRLDFSCKVKIC